jgi:hypothetical protein
VKIFVSRNTVESKVRNTARLAAVVSMGLALTVAACSKNAGSLTSPSAAAPASLDHTGSGAHKHFMVSISPAQVSANQTGVDLTVTITNDATSSAHQDLGLAEIVLPVGFTPTAVNSFSGAAAWGTNWTSGRTIVVGADAPSAGTKKLAPGSSVTFHVTVNTPSNCGILPLESAPRGTTNTLADLKAGSIIDYNFDYLPYNTVPTIEVINCVVDCPAAPSISAHYLQTIGISPGSSEGKSVQADVAQHMGQDATFDGYAPCDAGYVAAVIAYVDGLLAAL